MAIDSRAKRFGLIGMGIPVPEVLPNPDGAIDTKGERYDYLWLYPGDFMIVDLVNLAEATWTVPFSSRVCVVPFLSRVWSVFYDEG